MKRSWAFPILLLSPLLVTSCSGERELNQYGAPDSDLEFSVSFSEALSAEVQDGRLIVVVSKQTEGEPRFQTGGGPTGQQVFGLDVEGWAPGVEAVIDDDVFGFPMEGLGLIPAGEYRVQAVLNRYETFVRSDGHTVKLPPDRGEGQQWARKPGNFYSTPQVVSVDPASGGRVELVLDQVIPEIMPPEDTEWVKHVRIRSDLLSEFWGTDM
ncbi:MAG: hypothetical protein KJN92_06175, partial [Gemmatimonadetes bacterium]|nr:hypothetical protein [Gemmatimonadota bacterium]